MNNIQKLIYEYTCEMTEQEKLVMEIARDHLGSSFDIEKSIGFTKWLAKRTSNSDNKN